MEWIFISWLSFWAGLVSFLVLLFGPLVSLASAHRSSRSEWGHSNEKTEDKKCFRQCFCSQTKEGADVLSFLEDSFVLVVIRLDASVCRAFSSRRVLVRVDLCFVT